MNNETLLTIHSSETKQATTIPDANLILTPQIP
jgi:hypothetical protein